MSRGRVGVVPIKDFELAKSRLAGALSAQERRALSRQLAERSLEALTALRCRGELDEIVVLTGSTEVAEAALTHGALVQQDVPGHPLRALVDRALDRAAAAGHTEALVVMADLPRVSADALGMLLAAGAPALAPDHRGTGTNALLTVLPAPGPTAFGAPDSLARHLGVWGGGLQVVEDAALGLDLNEPADLRLLHTRPHVEDSR